MRIERRVFLPLVALVTAAAFVAAAGAALPRPAATPAKAKAKPAPAVVAKSVATLPGAGYEWVQPLWTARDGGVVPELPQLLQTRGVEPPASVTIQPTPGVVKTVATLPGAGYPWVQPLWRSHGSVVLPTLPSLPAGLETQPPVRIQIT